MFQSNHIHVRRLMMTIPIACVIVMVWNGRSLAQETGQGTGTGTGAGPGAELADVHEQINELRAELGETRELLDQARGRMEQLRRDRFDENLARRMEQWREERVRYNAERKALARERMRVDRSREELRHRMRMESDRLAAEARGELPGPQPLREHTEPHTVGPNSIYTRRYGSVYPDATYDGIYSNPLLPPYGTYGRVYPHRTYRSDIHLRTRVYHPRTRTHSPWRHLHRDSHRYSDRHHSGRPSRHDRGDRGHHGDRGRRSIGDGNNVIRVNPPTLRQRLKITPPSGKRD